MARQPLRRTPATDPPPRPTRSGQRGAWSGFAVALATGLALGTFGALLDDPAAVAESAYLTTLTVALLGAAAALQRGAADGALPYAAAATILAGVAPFPGPDRGAAVLTVLTLTLVVTALRRGAILARRAAAMRGITDTARWIGFWLVTAFATQAIFRGGELLGLPLTARTAVVFLAMPGVAALALALLTARRGLAAASLAAITAVVWSGGLDVAACVALVAIAAAEVLRQPDVEAGLHRLLLRLLAVALLAAPFAWQPRTAAVAVAAGCLLLGRPAVSGAIGLLATVAAIAAPLHSWNEVSALLGLGLLLLPALPVLGVLIAQRHRDWITGVAGIALVLATGRCAPALAMAGASDFWAGGLGGPHIPALAAPWAALAAWAATRQAADSADAERAGAARSLGAPTPAEAVGGTHAVAQTLQLAWSAGLFTLAGLAAAYPWLRPAPAREALAVLGLDPMGLAPVLLPAGATVLAMASAKVAGRRLAAGTAGTRPQVAAREEGRGERRGEGRWVSAAAPLVLALLLAGLVLAAPLGAPVRPFGQTLLGHPGVLLAPRQPNFETLVSRPAGGDTIHHLALLGSLVRAEGLADGTPVAQVHLDGPEGPVARWTLRAGDDLGEWAARRSEVAATLAHQPPPAWASWVAPGGDYLAQVYRSTSLPEGDKPFVASAAEEANGAVQSDAASRQSASNGSLEGVGEIPPETLRLQLHRAPELPHPVHIHIRRIEAW